jgi:hypothetical protein
MPPSSSSETAIQIEYGSGLTRLLHRTPLARRGTEYTVLGTMSSSAVVVGAVTPITVVARGNPVTGRAEPGALCALADADGNPIGLRGK